VDKLSLYEGKQNYKIMPPKMFAVPAGLVRGDTVVVRWEQKHDQRNRHIFNWRALVEDLEPLKVRRLCDEKVGQQHPDVLPFKEVGSTVLDIKIIPGKKKEAVLAPALVPAARSVKVLNGHTYFDVDPEWASAIIEAHDKFIVTPGAPEKITLTHCGVCFDVDLKWRTIGEKRQVLELGELQ